MHTWQTYASAACLLFNISSAFTRQLTETSGSLVLLWESSSMGPVQDGAAISYDYAQQERKELWWRWAAKQLASANLLAVQLTYHVCRLAMNDGSNQILLQELPIHQSLSKNMNKYLKEQGPFLFHFALPGFSGSQTKSRCKDAGWRRAVFDKQRSTAGLPDHWHLHEEAWASTFSFLLCLLCWILLPLLQPTDLNGGASPTAKLVLGKSRQSFPGDGTSQQDLIFTGTLAYFTDSTITFNVHLRCFLKNSFLKLTLRMTYLRGTTNR